MPRHSTKIHRHLNAPAVTVYQAIISAHAVEQWMMPTGMSSQVHAFDAREGGLFRISLTYDAPTGAGKTTAHTDTYHGRFVKLIPDKLVVQAMEFESDDPAMLGEMTVTFRLVPTGKGTDLFALHENLPPGVSAADNEVGWSMALDKLAVLVEPGEAAGP